MGYKGREGMGAQSEDFGFFLSRWEPPVGSKQERL